MEHRKLQEILEDMQKCKLEKDKEQSHFDADLLLIEMLHKLAEPLTVGVKVKIKKLIELYNGIDKLYA